MPRSVCLCWIWWLLFNGTLNLGYSDSIVVDLSNLQPGAKNNVYKEYKTITDPETDIQIKSISSKIDFFIIQLHTYIEKIILSYNSPLTIHSHVNGTNVGLFWGKSMINEDVNTTFYMFRSSSLNKNLTVLLVISAYEKNDPVPGGCNMSFETEIAPYQKIYYDTDMITVSSQPPSIYGMFCNKSNITTEMFHMFLPEYDYSDEGYFEGIEKMLTVKNITKYGRKVPLRGFSQFKQLYSLYRGTGRVFAVISTYGNRSSAYVPGVSFGCNLTNWEEECYGPVEQEKFLCALLLIFGTFVCFGGHKFFRITLYLIGYTFGVFITYLIVSKDTDFSTDGKAIFSLAMGIFYACFWGLMWWKFGIPMISTNLAYLQAGVLIASAVFYTTFADIYLFKNEDICFATFFIIVGLSMIILNGLSYTAHGHIFALSLLGSYAVVTAFNYYIGGNLQYIFINTYRRLTVKNFTLATISPPWEIIDKYQFAFWTIMFLMGCILQLRCQRGRPPFPPHRNGYEFLRSINERTPLIPPETPAEPQYT